MALTRARAIAGPDALKARVMAAVRRVLTRRRDADRLVFDVDDMRQRIAEQHRSLPALESKHRRGGMIDIEFIAQYLQLRRAPEDAGVLRTNTRAALFALAAADALPAEAAEALVGALTLWRNVQSLLKLTVEEPFDEDALAPALKALVAAGAGAVDFAALTRNMDEAAARVFDWYERLVALPAAAARARPDAPGAPVIAEEER
jgi:glutamate-ammonia-ligase adenylyltransferase